MILIWTSPESACHCALKKNNTFSNNVVITGNVLIENRKRSVSMHYDIQIQLLAIVVIVE